MDDVGIICSLIMGFDEWFMCGVIFVYNVLVVVVVVCYLDWFLFFVGVDILVGDLVVDEFECWVVEYGFCGLSLCLFMIGWFVFDFVYFFCYVKCVEFGVFVFIYIFVDWIWIWFSDFGYFCYIDDVVCCFFELMILMSYGGYLWVL